MLKKWPIYLISAIFLAPVLYSIIMAFKPEVTISMKHVDTNESSQVHPEKIYKKCAACHGANGDGSDGFPSLNTLGKQVLLEKMVSLQNSDSSSTNKAIMKIQLEGMSRATLEALAEYISTFKPNPNIKKQDKNFKEKKQEIELDTTCVNS